MRHFAALFTAVLLAVLFAASPLQTHAALDTDEVDDIIASIPKDWPEAPEIEAEAAILIDADSGEILYAKNATQKMYPASTTKLMTALLTLENASLQDIVKFSAKAVAIPSNSSYIGMRRGEQMVLRECLYGLLLPSANEVANALAEHVSGDMSTFVVRMNERMFQLGGVNTQFANPTGLHTDGHFTCAYDLALVMQECVKNSIFVEISSQLSYVHHADELLPKDIPMMNTNMMIRPSSEYYSEYVVCSKTGHTDESGQNLVSYAEKDGTRLVVVVMGCESGQQYVGTQSLLDYGFNYFHRVLPSSLDDSLNLENYFTASPLQIPTPEIPLLRIDQTSTILLPDNVTSEDLEKTTVDTPTGKQITYSYQGYPLGTVVLSYVSKGAEAPFLVDRSDVTLDYELPKNLNMIDGWLIVLTGGMAFVLFLVLIWLFRRFRRARN